MTQELPQPNSIWLFRNKWLMRVSVVGDGDIIANNVELAMRSTNVPLVSWRGNLERFSHSFTLGNEDRYPRLAS